MKTLKAISSMFLIAGLLFTAGCKKTTTTPAYGAFGGTVNYSTAGANTPASNAYVWLTNGTAPGPMGSTILKTFTDGSGNYYFTNIPTGTWYVNATYTDSHGYVYNSGGCTITINGSTPSTGVNVVLQ